MKTIGEGREELDDFRDFMIGLGIAGDRLRAHGGGGARRFLQQQFPERARADSDRVSYL